MYLVGLTGGIGSGKTEATRKFSALGVPVIDTDVIAHQLTSVGHPVLNKIIAEFGDAYLLVDGSLNRPAMREKVFKDPSARAKLEDILHPAIYDGVLSALEEHPKAPYQIIAVPLLFESDRYQKLVNRTLVIDCDESTQIARAVARGLTPADVRAIMAVQLSREKRTKLADDVIFNNGSLPELHQKIEDIHKNYMQTCIVSD
jgi:dephospho-CoA kinase